ncbi:MAG: glycosyltransferase involved in cell wall biosynthesis [Crocinitomicaceae bacterium]|jgi:glycosyltransferase involved in cell wall biosynthesis
MNSEHDTKATPLVSVWMVTYNHEKFIAKALDSVLAQKTDFDFEIVIGEDCSPDNTRAILKEYESKHSDLIRPIYHEKNVGASRNAYEFTLPKCRGKYIAVLEGDDYWTDAHKLQKQIDFLEANPDYSACGHQAEVIYDDQSNESKIFGIEEDATYVATDFIQHRKFHTSSLVYQHSILRDNGAFPLGIISADRAIFAMLSSFGKIKYMHESMCIYRKGSGGMSTTLTSADLQRDLKMIPWIRKANKSFPVYQLKSFIHLCVYSYPTKLSRWHLWKHYFLFGFYSFSYFPKNLGDLKYGTSEFFRRLFNRKKKNN